MTHPGGICDLVREEHENCWSQVFDMVDSVRPV